MGNTALHLSCVRDHLEVSRLLVASRGGTRLTEIRNLLDETPFLKACGLAIERMIRFFVNECHMKVDSGGSLCPLLIVLQRERRELRSVEAQPLFYESAHNEIITRIDNCIKTLVEANPDLDPPVIEKMWDRSSWAIRMYWIAQYCDKVYGVDVATTERHPLESIQLCAPLLRLRRPDLLKELFDHIQVPAYSVEKVRKVVRKQFSMRRDSYPNLMMIQALLTIHPRAAALDSDDDDDKNNTNSYASVEKKSQSIRIEEEALHPVLVLCLLLDKKEEGAITREDPTLVLDVLFRLTRVDPGRIPFARGVK